VKFFLSDVCEKSQKVHAKSDASDDLDEKTATESDVHSRELETRTRQPKTKVQHLLQILEVKLNVNAKAS
jgi:hypothetical protein